MAFLTIPSWQNACIFTQHTLFLSFLSILAILSIYTASQMYYFLQEIMACCGFVVLYYRNTTSKTAVFEAESFGWYVLHTNQTALFVLLGKQCFPDAPGHTLFARWANSPCENRTGFQLVFVYNLYTA
ncbi:hypothetical protein LJB83_01710 [Clostridia bacterium OttesenSCG-928-F22]|nr:hypothetical protein [Clostridia bacterium OttesenSCG-928-F22]